jgi:phage-related protein
VSLGLPRLNRSLADIRAFPAEARTEAGRQPGQAQKGNEPANWKPMKTIGPGVREIRIKEASGAFRVIYRTTGKAGVVVFHAFQKKAQKTPKPDIDLATRRYKAWEKEQ